LPFSNITGVGITLTSANVSGVYNFSVGLGSIPFANVTGVGITLTSANVSGVYNFSVGLGSIPWANITGTQVTIPAQNITNGTFVTGNWAFINNLTVNNLTIGGYSAGISVIQANITSGLTVLAANVTAGTFATGAYTFPSLVVNAFANPTNGTNLTGVNAMLLNGNNNTFFINITNSSIAWQDRANTFSALTNFTNNMSIGNNVTYVFNNGNVICPIRIIGTQQNITWCGNSTGQFTIRTGVFVA
jgi:hypothetical protein